MFASTLETIIEEVICRSWCVQREGANYGNQKKIQKVIFKWGKIITLYYNQTFHFDRLKSLFGDICVLLTLFAMVVLL